MCSDPKGAPSQHESVWFRKEVVRVGHAGVAVNYYESGWVHFKAKDQKEEETQIRNLANSPASRSASWANRRKSYLQWCFS